MQEITASEIQIVPVKPRNGLLAFTSFVLNDSFYIGDVAIYSRLNGDGLRLVYPMRTLSNGARVQAFHPINKAAALAIEKPISTAYENLILNVKKGKKEDELCFNNSQPT